MSAKEKAFARKKDSLELTMYKAVGAYVASKGGKVIVAGGIQIIQWPGESNFHFTVGIKCTGKKPQFAAPSQPTGEPSEPSRSSAPSEN